MRNDRRKRSPGSGLDEALARERPDARTIDETLAVVDDGVPDFEDELVAEESLERDEFASPEEAALGPAGCAGLDGSRESHLIDEG